MGCETCIQNTSSTSHSRSSLLLFVSTSNFHVYISALCLSMCIHIHSTVFKHGTTRHGMAHTYVRIQFHLNTACNRSDVKMCFSSSKLNQSRWECSTKWITSNNFRFRHRNWIDQIHFFCVESVVVNMCECV